jgi:ubiquinone/menaquinone biosynthesis C-methylase UbiE
MTDILGWQPIWEEIFREKEWGKYPPEYVIRFVARSFYKEPIRRAVRVLDLGCGPGACTWFVAREGFDVAGIDGPPSGIERARKRLKEDGLSADLRVGDFTTLPWQKECFDAVIDNAALYANPWDSAKQAIVECHRVLKPGGLLFSTSFTDRTWGFGTGPENEPGGFGHVTEGPMVGTGFCRFLGRSQLAEFYSPLQISTVELSSHTLESMTRLVELWLVTCRKASSTSLDRIGAAGRGS